MAVVLALKIRDELAAAIRQKLAPVKGARLEVVEPHAALRSVQSDPDGVEAIVVGSAINEPVQTAQRAFAVAPEIPVLLLTDRERYPKVRRALQFAPLIGEHVHCLVEDDAHRVADSVRVAIERRRKRAHHQATLHALNSQLAVVRRPFTPASELLERLLQRAPIGVVIIDEEGTMTALNACAARLLDTTEREAIGTSLFAVEAGAAELAPKLPVVTERETTVRPLTRTTAAGVRELETTMTPFVSRTGDAGYIVILRDVTEHNRLVASERRALHQAEKANRAKDEFLAMLGHELRNPLSPITTALQLIRLRGDDPFEREHTVIERQVQHLLRLVDDLLDISRVTRGKVILHKQPVEMGSVIAKAVEQVSSIFEQQAHRLELHLPDSGLLVEGDVDRLTQVMSNLLTNAAKYTPDGGEISVRAERSGNEVVVRIRDNGIGVAPELLPRIFEMFVQDDRGIDRSRGGLGLGLAIVQNLVALHGGSVSAHSAGCGRGSEFIVRLPALERLELTIAATDSDPSRVSVPTARVDMRILVVDDNVDATELLIAALGELGYQVRGAHEGPTALSIAAEFAPDVAIVDIGLPVMDGYELARRLQRLELPQPIALIALTGYGQPEDRARSSAAGFREHLVKPVQLSLLRDLLEQLGRRYAAR